MTDRKILQAKVREFLEKLEWNNTVAATLTLKQAINVDGKWLKIDDMHATSAMKHFLNVLNGEIYGNAARKKRIRCVPVYEGGRDTRYHYHLCLELPEGWTAEDLQYVIHKATLRTKWFDVIQEVKECDEGWLRYMTKQRSKRDYGSSIDWSNVSITG
jgi:hypothetical protein